MKKNSAVESLEKKGKGAFYQAGEIIGSIGFHIVDGKDKVIGVVSEEFQILKKAFKKKLSKKQMPESKSKKVSKKKLPGKAVKKIVGDVKKPAKKANPAKLVRGKAHKIKKPAKSVGKKDDSSD
jgi:hypothetical protein